MNADNLYPNLCQIFENKCINKNLVSKYEEERIPQIKSTINLFILQFLLNPDDKEPIIESTNDIWFLKDKVENINVFYKYIELMINLSKKEDHSKVNIYKEIELFINTEIGNKLVYMISLLNKLNLSPQINLLFIGFLLDEKKEFIRNNYIKNLQNLLSEAGSDINISPKMNIISLNEDILEIINLYIFFLINKENEKTSINSLKNYLISSVSDKLDIYIYYKKLEQYKLLDFLFFDNENDMPSDLFKQKVSYFMKNIRIKLPYIYIDNTFIIPEKSREKNGNNEGELFTGIYSNDKPNNNLSPNSPSYLINEDNNISLPLNNEIDLESTTNNNLLISRIEITFKKNENSINNGKLKINEINQETGQENRHNKNTDYKKSSEPLEESNINSLNNTNSSKNNLDKKTQSFTSAKFSNK